VAVAQGPPTDQHGGRQGRNANQENAGALRFRDRNLADARSDGQRPGAAQIPGQAGHESQRVERQHGCRQAGGVPLEDSVANSEVAGGDGSRRPSLGTSATRGARTAS